MLATAERLRLAPGLASPRVVVASSTAAALAFLMLASLTGADPSPLQWLGDPDDALRLVEVRELLEGAPWFDPTIGRVGAPEPLLSHWSRLVDLPLAALITLFRPALGQDLGELVTRLLWPISLFAALCAVVGREAYRLAGPWAVAAVALLAATSVGATGQFRPGRIDHHNVQIFCAVAGLLLLVRSLGNHRLGWSAGGLIGLGLAIGYEAIALVVPALALAALIALAQPVRRITVLPAAAAATGTLIAAGLLTIPPAGWFTSRCDSLSVNLIVVAASGTFGLWAAERFARKVGGRLAILAGAALAAASGFAALEPACLAGPFGQVDPALKPIWLDHVLETKSLLWFLRREPGFALAQFAFLLAGAAAQVALWRRSRDAGSTLATAIVLLAVALGCWQMKLVAYASWLALLPLACFSARLCGAAGVASPLVRAAALVLLNQATLDAAFSMAARLPPSAPPQGAAQLAAADPRGPCFQSQSVRALAALRPGLVAADVDLGPYIVALTPHRVVAAPYHRLSQGILANHAILEAERDRAEAVMRALGVDYIALCNFTAVPGAHAMPTLRQALLDNRPVAFLEPVAEASHSAIRAWRRREP
jgi:hypothetical protein